MIETVTKKCSLKKVFLNKVYERSFEYTSQSRINSRNNYTILKVPFRKTNMGQKVFSCIGPSVWKKILDSMKRNINFNMFKHDVKNN